MKTVVTILGGSGSMGFATFKALWKRGGDFRLKLLLLPLKREKKMFRPYLKQARPGQLEVIWGDATRYADVKAAIRGADYVLDAMAVISPAADYYPEKSKEVNTDAIDHVIRAIGEEPGGNSRIKLAHTGTVAQTGERRPPIHWGRVGDPLKPSLFDYYAVTKIAGERLVLESSIKHWVSLRVTGIMPCQYKGFFDRADPLVFHMPLDACMENITSRDAGQAMANIVDVPDDSGFWRGIYNMGGGPGMRIPAFEFLSKAYAMFGITDVTRVFDRRWFATTNFHMQYYVDSEILNKYLHFWKDSTDDWIEVISKNLPVGLKLVRWFALRSPAIERKLASRVRERNRRLLENHRNGTLHWRKNANTKRLDAFFGGAKACDSIPGWDAPLPELFHGDEEPVLLDHGYDETKDVLDLDDLQRAAEFRGGRCIDKEWSGDMFVPLEWECAFGHRFDSKPNTVLKGGHWCPDCEPPNWDFKRIAARNPFFNQVVEPFAEMIPDYPITMEDLNDIRAADKDDWR